MAEILALVAAFFFALAATLRDQGVRAEIYLEEGRDLGRQLRFAGKRGIPFAIIAGPDERARDVVAVRNMESGEQVEVSPDNVGRRLLELLRVQAPEADRR